MEKGDVVFKAKVTFNDGSVKELEKPTSRELDIECSQYSVRYNVKSICVFKEECLGFSDLKSLREDYRKINKMDVL